MNTITTYQDALLAAIGYQEFYDLTTVENKNDAVTYYVSVKLNISGVFTKTLEKIAIDKTSYDLLKAQLESED